MAKEKGQTKKYISEKEAAAFLGIAERTLRSWRRNGQIDNKGTKPPRAYARGRHIYYAEARTYRTDRRCDRCRRHWCPYAEEAR